MTVKKDTKRCSWYFVVDVPSATGKRQQAVKLRVYAHVMPGDDGGGGRCSGS